MKNGTLLAAATVIVVANGFALLHAVRNRTGQLDADITLTERELTVVHNDDDSGVALLLNVQDLTGNRWLDRAKLSALGFDCTRDPSDERVDEYYSRQVPRTAFVALKFVALRYDEAPSGERLWLRPSRLTAADADTDAARLREKYPDRNSVIVLPATIQIGVARPQGGRTDLFGSIENVPTSIHVQRPFSEKLRGHPSRYWVNVAFGSLLEPQVTSVETGAAPPGRPGQ